MKVLVVDDSKAMRLIVMRTLRQAGFSCEITEAADGKQALATVRADRPDLVLSDWNMPEMTGIELLEALRAEGNDVRLGFVTTEGTAAMRDRAKNAGALFLIAKPFTADHFRDALEPLR
jgi:two-component system chemotaxis response regulator CheY